MSKEMCYSLLNTIQKKEKFWNIIRNFLEEEASAIQGDATEEALLDDTVVIYSKTLKAIRELVNEFDRTSEDKTKLEIAGRLISLIQKVML